MPSRFRRAPVVAGLLVPLAAAAPLAAKKPVPPPSPPPSERLPKIADKVKNLTARPGLLTTYLDRDRGKLWAELPAPGTEGVVGEYLYVEGLLTGVGSTPIGLDRGQIGATRVGRPIGRASRRERVQRSGGA